MKRFFLSLTFCSLLLVSGAIVLTRSSSAAREDVVAAMLKLPAPAPPNPLVSTKFRQRAENFFDRKNPPPDDAPIDDLLDYWRHQNSNYRGSAYSARPSEAAIARMLPEIEKDPESIVNYLNVIKNSPAGVDAVKRVYDSLGESAEEADEDGEEEGGTKSRLKEWLTSNSSYFGADLEKRARQSGDENGYVRNQEAFHDLTRNDWERARPMVDRLYADGSQPASQTMARWALYRHAMETGSTEVDRFRDELKASVENRDLSNALRDLSLDALLMEKEWPGRDDWYYSLMSDETLVALRPYTGLTTFMIHSPDDKHIDKMIELSKSENKTIRTAAARNLTYRLDAGGVEVVRALLPWLADPKWVMENTPGRESVIARLGQVKVPESVPVLIAALDEKGSREMDYGFANSNSANMMIPPNSKLSEAANAMANAANAMSNAANTVSNANAVRSPETFYPLRYQAIRGLVMQADARAVPALRRLLPKVEPYEQTMVIEALLASNGYTVLEQADALEFVANQGDTVDIDASEMSNAMSNAVATRDYAFANTVMYASNTIKVGPRRPGPPDADYVKLILGGKLLQQSEISETLVRELIRRIEDYEKRDPAMAESLRRMFVNWNGQAVNALLLRDLKQDKSNTAAVLKLLLARKELREKQSADVVELRAGSPTAVGVSACLTEADEDYRTVLSGASGEAKAALFACGRLIRARLPVKEAAKYLASADKRLALAAELFLESEDSPEARNIVFAAHPGSAKILGATTAFWPETAVRNAAAPIAEIIGFGVNLGPGVTYRAYHEEPLAAKEQEVRKRLEEDKDLLGVYSYEEYFVHIYKDRAELSWTEDESRFRERVLTREEFTDLTSYLDRYNAEDQPAYLDCREYNCVQRQLLMAGRAGGRRVFALADRLPKFFAGLDAIFAGLRKTPGRLRYNLEKDIPGLEILYADDKLSAETVWKGGGELRILIADKKRRKQVEREIEAKSEQLEEEYIDEGGEAAESFQSKISAYRDERLFEEYAWFRYANGELGSAAGQPGEAEYIPRRDAHPVPPAFGGWTAKTGTIEVRASDEGLFLVSGGRMSKIGTGRYYDAVVTPNGKWAIVSKFNEDEGPQLVRVNLISKKEFPVKSDEQPSLSPVAFVTAQNKVLLKEEYYEEDDNDGYRELTGVNSYWLDAETGAVLPFKGEIRPLGQQVFRPLQQTAKLYEHWAAIPDRQKKSTTVGVYDSRLLTFKPVITIPKIVFNSMDMWVDAGEAKIYFVYSGHLLSLPLKPPTVK